MNAIAVVYRRSTTELGKSIASAIGGEAIEANADRFIPALQTAFLNQRPLVVIAATAIIIRALAPKIGSKHTDPPVICVSRDGKHVIPLLGLHHGGSRLADDIASALTMTAVHTAGTAALSRTPVDDPGPGYQLSNLDDYQDFAVALMEGEPICVEGDALWLSGIPQHSSARLRVTVTDRALEGSPHHLVFNQQTLAVGVGCERATDPQEVEILIRETLARNGLSELSVACHASIDLKEDEPAINCLDEIRFFSARELEAEEPRVRSPSETVRAEVGVASVAEAAALAAAGPDSELIAGKNKSAHATCAVARSPRPIIELPGRKRGTLYVIGLGPGDRELRSDEASLALWRSSDWVGYEFYLKLAMDMQGDHSLHPFPLGAEEDRVRHAIALAKEGKRVALVCSGDAGIYAMAALVYEIIDLEPCRIEVKVIPGISAFQAAAAKAGAMIGHDFCCISLSDLLTPWDVIEKRVKAAAEGDFVISFYNPRSLKRRDQLERAFAILKPHRPPDTPVIIASSLGRPEEKMNIVKFSDFNPGDVDMLTLVMVGSSQSKSFVRGDGRTYAYTPRGYARKREAAE